jgi:hypothetical protein
MTDQVEVSQRRSCCEKYLRGSVMRRAIEHFFEVVDANAGCAVFAAVTSLAMTGCLRFLWE